MVRLKALVEKIIMDISKFFQFQHGAIKGYLICEISEVEANFQFQHGAIKGRQVQIWQLYYHPFQFQHGAIKGIKRIYQKLHNLKLSIPTWCD